MKIYENSYLTVYEIFEKVGIFKIMILKEKLMMYYSLSKIKNCLDLAQEHKYGNDLLYLW